MKIEHWILRLRPQNLAIVSQSLATHLEKVMYDKRLQSSDLFDFAIFPFALLTRVQ